MVPDEIERGDAVVIAGDSFAIMMQEREHRRAGHLRLAGSGGSVLLLRSPPSSRKETRLEDGPQSLAMLNPYASAYGTIGSTLSTYSDP